MADLDMILAAIAEDVASMPTPEARFALLARLERMFYDAPHAEIIMFTHEALLALAAGRAEMAKTMANFKEYIESSSEQLADASAMTERYISQVSDVEDEVRRIRAERDRMRREISTAHLADIGTVQAIISNPGSILPREYVDDGVPESLGRWAARAIVAALTGAENPR